MYFFVRHVYSLLAYLKLIHVRSVAKTSSKYKKTHKSAGYKNNNNNK